MSEKVTIIGAGSWGCGLAKLLADNGHTIIMYDVDKDAIDEINNCHTNTNKIHTGILPDAVKGTNDLKSATKESDIIILAVPTAVIREVLKSINTVIGDRKLFINASKGIEPSTYKRVSEIVAEEIRSDFISGFVALTGPSHAEEVIMQMLTVIVAASINIEHAKRVQLLFSNNTYFRVYTVTDLIGAELGGSLKNIYALAAGICDGLGLGANCMAALITRSLAEMRRLAVAMGAIEGTLYGLTGIGDLIVTCTSKLSRNYQAGYQIGHGSNLEEALSKISMVVEGARSCKSAYYAAKDFGIYTPIIDTVYSVIYEQKDPRIAVHELMSGRLKDEKE